MKSVALTAALLSLGACADFDMDMRDLGNAFDTSEAARSAGAAPRPQPDARGVISYPSYQVAVARRGDTVADVAGRVGLPTAELARYNGVPEGAPLNPGEVLALPRRVAEPSPATGAIGTGPILPPGEGVDVTTLASAAIDRADTGAPRTQTGEEPARHKVGRGETAYSIARQYGVSANDLAAWNGLSSDLTVREGQYLLIPVAAPAPEAGPQERITAPGVGSPTPLPPSAAAPLPAEQPKPATAAAGGSAVAAKPENTPASPNLGESRTSASAGDARLSQPVSGSIIRDFRKGRNEGIDIAAAPGTPVKAAEGGTVAAITRDTDQVPIVVLRHNDGLLTVYANVDNLKISKGQTVKRGQQIAEIRKGDPAFLHFEVRDGLEAVDPNDYLN